MKNRNNRKTAYRLSFFALVMAGIMAFSGTVGMKEVMAARATLSRINTLTDKYDSDKTNISWKILEIVPSSNFVPDTGELSGNTIPMGSIGYLIGGQEPYNKIEDYRVRRDMINWLKKTKALDSITASNNSAPLTDAGDYTEYLEDMVEESASVNRITSIKETDIVSFDGIAMDRNVSGNYVKKFVSDNGIVSQNKAMEFLTVSDNSDFSSASDGDLQPAFTVSSDGKYNAVFEAVSSDSAASKKYGYRVKEATKLGANGDEWTDEMQEGIFVYVMNDDGVYGFVGTLSRNSSGGSFTISLNSAPSEDTTVSPDSVPAAEDKNEDEDTTVSPDSISADTDTAADTDEDTTTVSSVSASKNFAGLDVSGLVSGSIDGENINETEKTDDEKQEDEETGAESTDDVKGVPNEENGAGEGENAVLPEQKAPETDPRDEEPEKPDTEPEKKDIPVTGEDEEEADTDEDEEQNEEIEYFSMSVPYTEGAVLYSLTFEYTEDDENTEKLYHISSWSLSENGAGAYSLDTSRILVPDVTGEGCIKENDSSAGYIVYQYDKGKGTYLPSLSEGAGRIHERGAKVYYGGGWRNNEWFKRYVFDRDDNDEYSRLSIEVVTKSASEVTEDDIEEAKFVYIAAHGDYFLPGIDDGGYERGKRDIKPEVARRLLYDAGREEIDTPILAEKAVMEGADSCAKILVDAFNSRDYSEAKEKYGDGTASVNSLRLSDSDGTFVHYRVYVYDSEAKRVVNKDFDKEFEESFYDDGFTDVTRYINYFNNQQSNAAKKVESRVTEATAIRHIIAYEETYKKGVYRILEIQPQDMTGTMEGDDTFTLSPNRLYYDLEVVKNSDNGNSELWYVDHSLIPDMVNKTVSQPSVNKAKKRLFTTGGEILLTQISVQEFIGRIEDLNSEYDMIFIGADTSGMNTDFYGTDKSKYGTVYNDDEMNGRIYSGVGDSFKLGAGDRSDYGNLLGSPKQEGNKYYVRFSETDIIEADIKRITDFASAGLPILVEDKLLSISGNNLKGPNTTTVPKGSHMYEVIKDLLDNSKTKKNTFAISQIVNSPNLLNEYMEVGRPFVNLEPQADEEAVIDAKKDDAGNYYMETKFRITDDEAGKDTRYAAEFYLDRNSDGKYSPAEIDNEEIFEGERVETNGVITGLKKDREYTIRRSFHKDQNGCVPWRIIVYEYDNDKSDDEKKEMKLRRSCVGGYARIVREENKPVIKVLQLTSTTGATLNMQSSMRNNDRMGKYLRDDYNMMNFRLDVTTIRSDIFIEQTVTTHKAEDYRKYLENYDLVVCGFADRWQFGRTATPELNGEAAEGLRQYIAEGRSFLLSHDGASIHPDCQAFNNYITDVVGCNRFGFSGKWNGNEIAPVYDKDFYDDRYTGEDKDWGLGATYQHLYRSCYENGGDNKYGYNKLLRAGTKERSGNLGFNSNYYAVTQVNQGQITKYPYDLKDDEIAVSKTHAQHYQLNLNIDEDDDDMTDTVVWYCLGDGLDSDDLDDEATKGVVNKTDTRIYRNSTNDVRNNYFIYSKGNVTYTGQGHSNFANSSDAECKLFINTIIASYSSGVLPPTVTIHANADISSAEKQTQILPFDVGLMEEGFNKGRGSATDLTYVDIEDYPDYGDGKLDQVNPDTGPYLKMYFLPSELNVNVESSQTEVAFFVDDADGGILKRLPYTEIEGESAATKENYMDEKLSPLQVVSLKRIDIDENGNSTMVEIPAGGLGENAYEMEGGTGAAVQAYTMTGGMNGYTMYELTYRLSDIVSRQTMKTDENGLEFRAINNLPKVYIVMHTDAVKFKRHIHPYNPPVMLKYARAQLFMLE